MSMMGVWMWPQSVRQYGAQSIAARCAQTGVTDIYFLTKGLAGTTSHLSKFAPACCERDLLQELLDAAHALGIRVHAWLTSASDEHYKRLYPDSGRCHYTRGKDKGLISLADESYLAYMETVVQELCRGYDIDGLHLDYIRYNHLLYGWADEDMDRYAAAGANIAHLRSLMDRTFLSDTPDKASCIFDALRAGDESIRALASARRRDVTAFATTLVECARAEKSCLILSAALMPEGAYSDSAFADLHYGQSYEDASVLYHYVLPMAYSRAYEKDSQWVRSVAECTLRKGLKTVMGLHAYEGGTGPSLKEDILALQETEISGICLFREGAFATAFADGRHLHLSNTLDRPITAMLACPDESMIRLDSPLLPGEERNFALPSAPDVIRIFTGDNEACVYLASHEKTP